MSSLIDRTGRAIKAAVTAFRDDGQPGTLYARDLERVYAQRWAYYENHLFDQAAGVWGAVYARPGLYDGMRPIYNPSYRAVEFFADNVWRGSLSEDGRKLPDGFPIAVPLAEDMTPALKDACAQIWQWSNFQSLKSKIPRWGAALGDVLVTLNDNIRRGQVYFELVWPGDVVEVVLDRDNIERVVIQYNGAKDAKGFFTYRKEMDKQAIRTFRDGQPYAFGDVPAVQLNPYGFVPARWIKHRDLGAPNRLLNRAEVLAYARSNLGPDRGAPAVFAVYDKIDHMIALASHIHDLVHRTTEGAMMISTKATGKALESAFVSGMVPDPNNPGGYRRDPAQQLLLIAPDGSNAVPLLNSIDLGGALEMLQHLMDEIIRDLPVLNVYEQIRGVSQPTGPAIERMVGDAAGPLYAAQGQYDQALISLCQMAVAMAGERYAQRTSTAPDGVGVNGWAADTQQQQKFRGFDLKSYEAGNLDVVIMPRPLLTPTEGERNSAKLAKWAGVAAAKNAGAPLELAMRDFGFGDQEIAASVAEQAARDAKAAQIQQNIQNAQQQNGGQQPQGVSNGTNNG